MTIEETIELIQTKLNVGITVSTDELYNVYISIDPYENLEAKLQKQDVLLIEDDISDLDNSATGFPFKSEHNIDITCLSMAQNKTRTVYKSAVNSLMKNAVDKMMTISDGNIQSVTPYKLEHGDLMIGSLKAAAITIKTRVKTEWEDLT